MPKLRIEFLLFGAGRGRLGGQVDLPAGEPLGSVTLDVTGAPTAAENRPLVPSGAGTVFARLLSTDAALYVDIGAPPDPGTEPRLLLLPGRAQLLHVAGGHSVSAVIAGDVSVSSDSGTASLLDRSGTLAAGAAAQQACPSNHARRILIVSNPDDARTFWFNTTGPASAGASSVQVGPGGAFIFDKVVPSGAVSIYGASIGQPFTVKEA